VHQKGQVLFFLQLLATQQNKKIASPVAGDKKEEQAKEVISREGSSTACYFEEISAIGEDE